MNRNFKNKYIKYKTKYIQIKNQHGGSLESDSPRFKIYYCNNSESIEITDDKLYELLSVLDVGDNSMLLKSNIQYYINNDSESKPELLQNLKPVSLNNIVLYKNEGCVFPKKPLPTDDTISSNNIFSFQLKFIEKKTEKLIPSRLACGNNTVLKHLKDDFREAAPKEHGLNGLHTIKDDHGIYSGYFKNNMKHGNGTYYFKNQTTYSGNFENNMMYGQGVFTEVDDEKYIGNFVNNNYEGHGKIVKPIFETKIVDGKNVISKVGEYIYYEGDFHNNMKHGNGIENYANNDKYEGQFRYNRRNGNGVLTFNNGNLYIGEFSDGKKNGNGIFKFINGNIYNGEYRNDKREGKGIFNFKNGDIYIGDFLNDKFHGNGKYTKANGSEYTGTFINNKFIKE